MRNNRVADLTAHLETEFGDDLRWLVSFNTKSHDYDFHHIRDDLETELSGHQLDRLIHRSLAVFSKHYLEEIYFHLGPAEYLISAYERGIAVHIYLARGDGLVIMFEPDVDIGVPGFIDDCLERIE